MSNPTAARCTRRLRLRPDVYAATDSDGRVTLLLTAERDEQLGRLTRREKAMLRWLAGGWRTEAELRHALSYAGHPRRGSAAHAHPGFAGHPHEGFGDTLPGRLRTGGWLTVELSYAGRALVTVRPLRANHRPWPAAPAAPVLSRFAVLHRDGDALVLESPLATAAVTVHDASALAALHQIATTSATGSTAAAGNLPLPWLPGAVVDELLAELAWHGFVHDAHDPDDTRSGSTQNLATQQWGAHELWFHRRSRGGGHDQPLGGTLWAAGRFDPLPARRPPLPVNTLASGPIALPSPAADASLGPSFAAVLGARRSIREHDPEHPLTVAQFGEFLHHSARVDAVAVDGWHEISRRPSPSGGALHGLEIYPVVANVDGLPAGMYHYDPFDHVLEPVRARDTVIQRLLGHAHFAAGAVAVPQVLFVISCRFGRVMWKYQGLGYALVLKDVGALYQTMYLVATAMGLAPCALGSGDTELFAQATGLDQLVESSVGEFILGSRRSEASS